MLVLVLVAAATAGVAPPAAAAPASPAADACAGVVCLIDRPILDAVMGERHQCFLLEGGDVVCGGSNDAGQAIGRQEGDAVAISAGAAHTCALLVSGNVACFGYNFQGQADGYSGGDAVRIDAGAQHTCAVLANGNVACWGEGGNGQTAPWRGGHVVDVDVTTYYTCALFDNGTVDCWGSDDEFFQLCYCYTGGDAVAIGGGDQHTCVVLASGNVRCFGTAHWGAQDPYDGGDAIAVDGGYEATCILTRGGDVLCQGLNTAADHQCVGYPFYLGEGEPKLPASCEGLDLYADTRSRHDGRVRGLAITPWAEGACYVLDDATAECQGGLVPVAQAHRDAANEVELSPRGAALPPFDVATPAIPVHQETVVRVPVRICLFGLCVGYVILDPGVGPIDEEVAPVGASSPLDVSARIGTARVVVDPRDPGATDARVVAEACAMQVCLAAP